MSGAECPGGLQLIFMFTGLLYSCAWPWCDVRRNRIGHYGCRCEQARWAPGRYTCRMGAVQAEDAGAIMVRNAHEMLLWCDAQVPDRLLWDREQAA